MQASDAPRSLTLELLLVDAVAATDTVGGGVRILQYAYANGDVEKAMSYFHENASFCCSRHESYYYKVC